MAKKKTPPSREQRFYDACCNGDLPTVKELCETPGFDVNWQNPSDGEFTGLEEACFQDKPEVVRYLLELPEVDVNQEDNSGWTPLSSACGRGNIRCVQLILLLGRNLDTQKRTSSEASPANSTAEEVAKVRRHPEIFQLLQDFARDPVQTKLDLSWKLGICSRAGAVFAQLVFVCDGLLEPKNTAPRGTIRFFDIARKVHLDLLFVLANRVTGSSSYTITSSDRNLAFKLLAQSYEKH